MSLPFGFLKWTTQPRWSRDNVGTSWRQPEGWGASRIFMRKLKL